MRRGTFLVASILVFLAFSAPRPEAAEKLSSAIVVVIDYERVMGEAVAAVEVRRQIETLRDKYQEETRREEQELREEQKRLGERQSTLEPAEFERERNLFQKKVRDTQRKVQARSRGLDVTFAKAMEQLRTGLVSIVSDLTAEMGFNIVLEKSQIIMADKTLDITDTVLERLNKRVPKVTIEPLPDPNSTAN